VGKKTSKWEWEQKSKRVIHIRSGSTRGKKEGKREIKENLKKPLEGLA